MKLISAKKSIYIGDHVNDVTIRNDVGNYQRVNGYICENITEIDVEDDEGETDTATRREFYVAITENGLLTGDLEEMDDNEYEGDRYLFDDFENELMEVWPDETIEDRIDAMMADERGIKIGERESAFSSKHCYFIDGELREHTENRGCYIAKLGIY